MPRPNPFVYGEVVPASAFVDREAELDRLTADLADGQKVFLISPRRYGKSSLIRQALAALGAARHRSPSRSRSAATARTSRFSRATPAPLAAVETRVGPARGLAARAVHDGSGPRCARAEAGRRRASPCRFPAVRTTRDAAGWRTKSSRCRPDGRGAPPARLVDRAGRVPGDRRLRRRQRRAALRAAVQQQRRSATSSPDPSRA